LSLALVPVFNGALQEAGEAITLPFLGPLLQRNLRTVFPFVRFQALVAASTISSAFIVCVMPCSLLALFLTLDLLSWFF